MGCASSLPGGVALGFVLKKSPPSTLEHNDDSPVAFITAALSSSEHLRRNHGFLNASSEGDHLLLRNFELTRLADTIAFSQLYTGQLAFRKELKAGGAIIENDMHIRGNKIFIAYKGSFRVFENGQAGRVIKPGQIFGDEAFANDINIENNGTTPVTSSSAVDHDDCASEADFDAALGTNNRSILAVGDAVFYIVTIETFQAIIHPDFDVFGLSFMASSFGANGTEKIQQKKEIISLKRGETMVTAGDECTGFYIVLHGLLDVEEPVRVYETPAGARKPSVLHPGDYFGEYALVLDVKEPLTVKAFTDVRLYKLSTSVFRSSLCRKLFENFDVIIAGKFMADGLRYSKDLTRHLKSSSTPSTSRPVSVTSRNSHSHSHSHESRPRSGQFDPETAKKRYSHRSQRSGKHSHSGCENSYKEDEEENDEDEEGEEAKLEDDFIPQPVPAPPLAADFGVSSDEIDNAESDLLEQKQQQQLKRRSSEKKRHSKSRAKTQASAPTDTAEAAATAEATQTSGSAKKSARPKSVQLQAQTQTQPQQHLRPQQQSEQEPRQGQRPRLSTATSIFDMGISDVLEYISNIVAVPVAPAAASGASVPTDTDGIRTPTSVTASPSAVTSAPASAAGMVSPPVSTDTSVQGKGKKTDAAAVKKRPLSKRSKTPTAYEAAV